MQYATKRLLVGPFLPEDEAAGIALFTNDEVKKTYMLPDFETREQAAGMFARLMQLSKTPGRQIAAIHYNGRMIGMINETEVTDAFIEMGYAFHPDFWGKGFATEALTGAIEWLLNNGFKEVQCGAFPNNKASIRVMEKSGMQPIDKVEEVSYRGATYNCVFYAARAGEVGP